MKTSVIGLCLSLTAFVTGCSARSEVIIFGNQRGVWSPTHPQHTAGRSLPPGQTVRYVPTLPDHVYEVSPVHELPVVEEEVSSLSAFDVCPTQLSAPHLCQSNATYKLSLLS